MAGLPYDFCSEPPNKGFSFENCKRNIFLEEKGMKPPKALKTGTTIVGIVYKDGVVLGADTRATDGGIVAEKNCDKIHYLAPNIYCCGAGTAADTEMTTRMISSNLYLHRLSTGRVSRVVTAMTLLKRFLYRYHGYISAALIVGGVDPTGPDLHSIHPHGSSERLPYVTMGSGSLAAMSVLEDGYKPNLDREEAIQLVRAAVRAGIFNDLGSGSNVDLCVITRDKTDYLRNYDIANVKGKRQGDYRYKRGSTAILSSAVKPVEVTTTVKAVPMDSS